MIWDNGESLTKLIVDLEDMEQRLSAGDRSPALRQAAQRTYRSASANTNAGCSGWCREIMERAKAIIDACS